MGDCMRYLADVVTLEFFPEKCTGCQRCIEVCPHGVFAMKGQKVVLVDKDLCMECGACARNCVFGAIRVNAGVGCATAILNGIMQGGEPSCGCDASSTSCCC